MTGAGFDAVVVAVEELLVVFGSVDVVAALAVFEITVPFATAQLIVATNVTVTVPPAAIEPADSASL